MKEKFLEYAVCPACREILVSEDFTTINGISKVISSCLAQQRG